MEILKEEKKAHKSMKFMKRNYKWNKAYFIFEHKEKSKL